MTFYGRATFVIFEHFFAHLEVILFYSWAFQGLLSSIFHCFFWLMKFPFILEKGLRWQPASLSLFYVEKL